MNRIVTIINKDVTTTDGNVTIINKFAMTMNGIVQFMNMVALTMIGIVTIVNTAVIGTNGTVTIVNQVGDAVFYGGERASMFSFLLHNINSMGAATRAQLLLWQRGLGLQTIRSSIA